MAITDKNTIYSWFQTDDFPTEEQFRATWDSFWHKSESIPMSQITGLNQLFQQTATVAQLNDKANVDGSNIDVSAYQEKLNITNLIATAKEEVKTELLNGAPEAFDTLKEISDWISDDETAEAAILQAIQNEATARTNADNLKLNKPTTTSTTTSYPYVVGEDGNGNSARLPAGDLGKNFFNSDLNNTTARNHTMNAGVTVNTLGNPHTLSGLPNKNIDIANFRKVRVQNASGLDAVVDSKSMLLDMPSYLTEQERTNWKTAMNGGWTTATMSSYNTTRIIDKTKDRVSWVFIYGANLNLPTNSMVVSIVFNDGTEVIIPNSQVITGDAGILRFYYNFYNSSKTSFRVKLFNGVAEYTTNIDILLKNIVETINIPNILWGNELIKDGGTSTNLFNGGNITLNSISGIAYSSNMGINSVNKSIFSIPSTDNFIILGNMISYVSALGNSYGNLALGLVDSTLTKNLSHQALISLGLGGGGGPGHLINKSFYVNNGRNYTLISNNNTSTSFKYMIIKEDNVFSLFIDDILVAQKTFINLPANISFFTIVTETSNLMKNDISILEFYKI